MATHSSIAPKSIPRPGVTSSEASRSAWVPCPAARSASTFCAFVVPAGSRRLKIPANTRSVAWPSSRGPVTVSPTLTVASPTATVSRWRCGRSRRRLDPAKSADFSAAP